MTSDPLRKEYEELLYSLAVPVFKRSDENVAKLEAFALRMKQEALREAADDLMGAEWCRHDEWLRARAEEVSRP